MDQDTTYVAFDTSKETLAVAIAEGGRRKEVRFFGTIASRPEVVRKLVEKLAKQHRCQSAPKVRRRLTTQTMSPRYIDT